MVFQLRCDFCYSPKKLSLVFHYFLLHVCIWVYLPRLHSQTVTPRRGSSYSPVLKYSHGTLHHQGHSHYKNSFLLNTFLL